MNRNQIAEGILKIQNKRFKLQKEITRLDFALDRFVKEYLIHRKGD